MSKQSAAAATRSLDPVYVTKAGRRLRPLGPRVIVKRTDAEKVSPGGILIPDTAKEKPAEGVVMALGSGVRLDDGTLVPAEVRVGDTVLWGRFGGNEIKLDGEEHFSIHQDEILAVVEA